MIRLRRGQSYRPRRPDENRNAPRGQRAGRSRCFDSFISGQTAFGGGSASLSIRRPGFPGPHEKDMT